MIRGVRGATTVEENNENVIVQETLLLVKEMIEVNQIQPSAVASVFISATSDITDSFPAKALREIDGWKYVPVMCMQELNIKGGLSKCIRVMMHVNTDMSQEEINHIYLNKAIALRPDLREQ